ncbi:hypothetical protein Z949_23 [Sulfitobacter guttiformis KCTC 32187]|nr:hypothetical protein Z949_23 [Sulfitobacter guttiformis KCTC 32187]
MWTLENLKKRVRRSSSQGLRRLTMGDQTASVAAIARPHAA